jgi:hypothetical protein
MHRHSSRKVPVVILVVLLMAVSIAIPFWSSDRWNSSSYLGGDLVEVDSRVFSDASYLRVQYGNCYAISSSLVLSSELAASSDVRVLGSGAAMAINDDLTRRDIERNVTWTSEGFPTNLYHWFEYEHEPNVDFYVQILMVYGMSMVSGPSSVAVVKDYFSTHSKIIVAVDNNNPSSFAGVWSVEHCSLSSQLKSASWQSNPTQTGGSQEMQSYVVYESQRIMLFAVQLFG